MDVNGYMKEANIAEIGKRRILADAKHRCESCRLPLGHGKNENQPVFFYIIPPLQGGENSVFNITVLCSKDCPQVQGLSDEELLQIVRNRENYFDLS